MKKYDIILNNLKYIICNLLLQIRHQQAMVCGSNYFCINVLENSVYIFQW